MSATTGHYVNRVLETLERVECVTGGWIACCPLHADGQRSLRIAEHNDQVFVRCARRCAGATVAAFIEALVATPVPTEALACASDAAGCPVVDPDVPRARHAMAA